MKRNFKLLGLMLAIILAMFLLVGIAITSPLAFLLICFAVLLCSFAYFVVKDLYKYNNKVRKWVDGPEGE